MAETGHCGHCHHCMRCHSDQFPSFGMENAQMLMGIVCTSFPVDLRCLFGLRGYHGPSPREYVINHKDWAIGYTVRFVDRLGSHSDV